VVHCIEATAMLTAPSLLALATAGVAREITFPPVAAIQQPFGASGEHDVDGPIDVSGAIFGGLMTYANLPYVHCLAAEGEEVEKYDVAVLGAPFDTVSCAANWVEC